MTTVPRLTRDDARGIMAAAEADSFLQGIGR